MRIAVGSLMQETNTFAPVPTNLESFAAGYLWYDEEVTQHFQGARVEIAGFLDTLQAADVTAVPLLAAHAYSGGLVERGTFAQLIGELIQSLRRALPVEGVLLALHGAMVVEDETDAEGSILAAVRMVVGPDVPIAASLDLHGHITPNMLAQATILVGYQTYPHIDMYETGSRTAALLLDTLRGHIHPVMALSKRPMIVSPVSARTTEEPFKQLIERAVDMEQTGRVLAASLFPVQPWLDVPDLGFGALIVADSDADVARAAAEELAEQAWNVRADFEPNLVTLPDAIQTGLQAADGTTVVGDAGDAPSGGAPADHAAVLRELLRQAADQAARLSYLTLCDSEAARAAATAGIGSTITLPVGHKRSPALGEPLTITGRVCAITDGSIRMHGQGSSGMSMELGLTAVLAIGAIRLAVRSLPAMEWDPAIYTSVGLNPAAAALIFVKSPTHFRASFAPLAARLLVADSPGVTRANMRALTFTHVNRPLYPLDES